MRVRVPPPAPLRLDRHGAIRLVQDRALFRRTPTLVQSPCDAAATNDRPMLATPANDLVDLNRGLGQMHRDLMETHPDVQKSSAPHRRAGEGRVRDVRQTRVAAGASLSE